MTHPLLPLTDVGKSKKQIREHAYRTSKHGVLVTSFNAQNNRVSRKGLMPVTYSFIELSERYLDDPKFNRLFLEWVKSGYKKEFKPSFDRINRKKTYSLDNITVMTWAENKYKQRMEAKKTKVTPIVVIKDGTEVGEYFSISEAARKLGLRRSNISTCLCGAAIHHKGYTFRYVNPENVKKRSVWVQKGKKYIPLPATNSLLHSNGLSLDKNLAIIKKVK